MIRKPLITLLICIIPGFLFSTDDSHFTQYFTDNTLRIDYFHAGDAGEEIYMLDQIYKQSAWAGPISNLTEPKNLGKYFYKVYDKSGTVLLYARGFDTYFAEYQTTEPAKNGIRRSYHETAILPFPRDSILFVIEKRDRNQKLHPVYDRVIDPADYHIIDGEMGYPAEIIEVENNGDHHEKVDIVILGEGYSISEKEKFQKDLKKYKDIFFSMEPYMSLQEKFNLTGVFVASAESGVDEPRKKIYKNTMFKCTFNSLDSERYLLTEANKIVRDYAGLVPYDVVFIMVNSDRYGGGGIYNTYCTFTSDGPWNDFVFHHEVGHSLSALADEYFSSDVSYEEFYPRGLEPLEPNITALLDPDNVKWKKLLTPGIEVPTPWGKETYEELTNRFDNIRITHQNNLKNLHDRGATKSEVEAEDEDYRELQKIARRKLSDFFEDHPMKGKVDVFQGAGYDPTGFYRPTVNSMMHRFSKSERTFYPVNEAAIISTIQYYTK